MQSNGSTIPVAEAAKLVVLNKSGRGKMVTFALRLGTRITENAAGTTILKKIHVRRLNKATEVYVVTDQLYLTKLSSVETLKNMPLSI